jgi:hypothetical protein
MRSIKNEKERSCAKAGGEALSAVFREKSKPLLPTIEPTNYQADFTGKNR